MKIGIIGAMEKEINHFKEIFDLNLMDNKHQIYKANIKNKEVFVCLSGIGKVNASIKTQVLIDNYNVDLIINTGCAGSLDECIKILDIVIPSYLTYHDFLPERIMKISTPNDGKIKADTKLNKLVMNILDEKNLSYKIVPICSGDSFVTDSTLRDEIRIRTGAYVVDMESASIAHTCSINEIPFTVVRTISDNSDGVDDFEEKASNISALIVSEMISRL